MVLETPIYLVKTCTRNHDYTKTAINLLSEMEKRRLLKKKHTGFKKNDASKTPVFGISYREKLPKSSTVELPSCNLGFQVAYKILRHPHYGEPPTRGDIAKSSSYTSRLRSKLSIYNHSERISNENILLSSSFIFRYPFCK